MPPRSPSHTHTSYANAPGSRSQAAFLNIAADKSILSGRASGGLLEHSSRKISRVVRSTMAAESASLAAAVDHHLYCRLLWQHLLYGGAPVCGEWEKNLVVGGCVVTDAKRVFDHLSKTGSLPAERQTLLDLLSVKEYMEDQVIETRWVPSFHMLDDPLTKVMRRRP